MVVHNCNSVLWKQTQGMGRAPGCFKEEEEKEEKEKKADEGQEEVVRSRGHCYFCFPRQQHSSGNSKRVTGVRQFMLETSERI